MDRRYLKTLLILGRTSNLPTVWSNCLAAALLTGSSSGTNLFFSAVAGSFLYLGGMFLNDAFDADFDNQFRRERPIPSGAIPEKHVWLGGIAFMAIGLFVAAFFGWISFFFAIALAAFIILYNAIHKAVEFSPVLMALCRLFLYLLAASICSPVYWGYAVWPGIALAAYIVGLSYIARKETGRGVIQLWPAGLMCFPILLAFVMNDGSSRKIALFWIVMALGWILYSLKHTFWAQPKNIPRTVTGLLAGIILVDAALASSSHWLIHLVFASLFVCCRLFQRFIPAT